MKKRILSLLLCLAVAMLPTVALAAAGPSAIRLDAANSFGITGGGVNWVYYGEYNGTPVKWRVLDANNDYDSTTGGTQSALFLLSEYLLAEDSVCFDSAGTSNAWQGSTAQDWCGDFYSNNFDTAEQSAIAATTKTDSSFTSSCLYNHQYAESANILNGDKVFFLSTEEVETSSYGFSSNSSRIAMGGSGAGVWWLRSPYASTTIHAGMVWDLGHTGLDIVSYAWSARPAFNLNLSSILFSSAAVGGKSSGAIGAGALHSVAATTPTEWKLTLMDNSRSFAVSETTATVVAGNSVELHYNNATAGVNEYISALLVDGSGNILYYGRMKAVAAGDENGTVDVTIPADLAAGSYTLKVFSEQYNGDWETDYASGFSNVSLTVDRLPEVSSVTPSGTGVSTSGNIVITFSKAINTTAGGQVSLDGGVTSLTGGTWSNGDTTYTIPYSGLSYNTTYTISISGFRDVAGNVMTDYSHSFTTAATASPGGGGGSGGGSKPSGKDPRTLTDSVTGIIVSGGGIRGGTQLIVQPLSLHEPGQCAACDAIRQSMADSDMTVLFEADLSLSRSYSGELTITIPVGTQYNGQTLTLLHCYNGELETLTAVVTDGKAVFTVRGLSPVALVANAKDAAAAAKALDDIPITDDRGTALIWWLLCGASAMGMAVLILLGRKKRLF